MLDVSVVNKLQALRKGNGAWLTEGLSLKLVERFLSTDPDLVRAIDGAYQRKSEFVKRFPELAALDEAELIKKLQDGILNFYPSYYVNPFVPLYAKGPWIITFYGAVVYETGGYGMLGLGHSPDAVIDTVGKDVVMANIMSASFSQRKFVDKLRARIGIGRSKAPYSKFLFMNSGSEAMTVALRISDIRAKTMTDPGGRYEGRKIMFLGIRRAFHGRTDRPAQVSDSSAKSYQVLASFRDRKNLLTIESNNVSQLEEVYARAERENIFIESMVFEPVMGEGNPGQQVSVEFYNRARQLTREHGSFLIADSIQAGLRAHGVLSIVDYPGFERSDAPDMESFSKAVNAAQFPLSVLAMNEEAVSTFKPGVYGNTMTANPRALEIGCATLDAVSPEIVQNIRDRGVEFVAKLGMLMERYRGTIIKVQGTGLLISAELNPSIPVVGDHGVEQHMRRHGVSVIHGGENALRFTPCFTITSQQIDLIIEVMRDALDAFVKKPAPQASGDEKNAGVWAKIKALFS